MKIDLVEKYNTPTPRYTSYPSVPYWGDVPPTPTVWKQQLKITFHQHREISLYIHLPYCESLCTYCGCNKHITKNHKLELPYIESLLAEWKLYTEVLVHKPVLRELHLGGGTPTFFHLENLERLITKILDTVEVPRGHDFSFEAHPNSTTYDHLQTLKKLGFNRISIGIQDFAPDILHLINRFQTETEVANVVHWARELNYDSINFDLIFGLPKQTLDHIRSTMEKVAVLKPERIAFYSYAHVPWVKPSQRAYSEADLPQGKEKRALYELGRALLEEAGYIEIGMDHFALPADGLYQAMQTGTMHRNFMGYTPYFTGLSIGLGASAISDSWTAFAQNEKSVLGYQAAVARGELPIFKGYVLTREDRILRQHILNLMCRLETSWYALDEQCDALSEGLKRLEELEKDGLVELQPFTLKVTEAGRPFIRNIGMMLDACYWRRQPTGKVFSQTV